MARISRRPAVGRRARAGRLTAGGLTLATLVATCATLAAPLAQAVVPVNADGVITSAGPIKTLGITSQLNCYVRRTDDADGEWYDGTHLSDTMPRDVACGTFAVVNGALYGPTGMLGADSAIDAETATWTPVSQSPVTGAGTAVSPYTLVTTVAAGATGVTVTETDTYVSGQDGYTTFISTANASAAPVALTVYHAGDCFLQDEDDGFGVVDANTGSAGCLAETLPPAAIPVRGTRVEQLFPLTPASAYMEGDFNAVWSVIGAKAAYPDTCACTSFIDNGVGLSWVVPSVAPGTSVQEGLYTSMSPTGIVPATASTVADAPTVAPGGADGYTITVHNGGAAAIHLLSLSDVLPPGFTYTAGSTTGLSTSNPTIAGQSLTWPIPSTAIAAGGSATLHVGFKAASTVADYLSTASGVATETAVVPSGPFTPLHVIVAPGAPTSVTAFGGVKAATVSWAAPTAGGNTSVTGYDLQITPRGKAPRVVSFDASVLSRVIGGLTGNTGYSFQVRARNAAGTSGWSAVASLGGSRVSVHRAGVVTFGRTRLVAATVTSRGRPLRGVRVRLLVRQGTRRSFTLVRTLTSTSRGLVSLRVKPTRDSVYKWVFAGSAAHIGSAAERSLDVAPRISLALTGGGQAFRGAVVLAAGKVLPVFAKQKVALQQLAGQRWVTIGSATIAKSGAYAFTLPTGSRGTVVYRVVKAHVGSYVTGYSAQRSLTVS